MARRIKIPEIKEDVFARIYRFPSGQWMIETKDVICPFDDDFANRAINLLKQLIEEYSMPEVTSGEDEK